MATTSATDGAIDLEAFLDRLARDGASIVIERDGRPAAILAPYRESAAGGDPAGSGSSESEARLRAIMDRAPFEIGLKDTAGRYVMVSRRFEELNGVTSDEVVGKTAYDVFPEETARVIEAHDAEVLRSGEVSEREVEAPLDDGVHTYLAVKFPVVDAEDRVSGVGAIAIDITERKRAQEAMREARDDLEAQIATRTGELSETNRALRAREAELKQVHQITRLGHWSWHPETDRLSLSPEAGHRAAGTCRGPVRRGVPRENAGWVGTLGQ
jgi:PAS domain S-box-containing protein